MLLNTPTIKAMGHDDIITIWQYSKNTFKWYPYHIFPKKASTTFEILCWMVQQTIAQLKPCWNHLQWLKQLSQCFALFGCWWHSITTRPNKAKVLVDVIKDYIRATFQIKNYVIWWFSHRDMGNSIWWLIGTIVWVGIRNIRIWWWLVSMA